MSERPIGVRLYRDCDACGGLSNEHPTRHVVWRKRAACVDEGVADLILACWQRGIGTDESCQDFEYDGSCIFLAFSGVADYLRFARAVMLGGPKDALYNRVIGIGMEPTDDMGWEWSCYPVDVSVHWEDPNAPVEPEFLATVLIPTGDVPATVRRLVGKRSSDDGIPGMGGTR